MALDGFRYAGAGPALLAADGKPATRESHLSEHLPFVAFHGADIMVLREGDLMATLRLDGLSALTTPDGELDALKRAVAAIVAQTGNAFGLYVHRIAVPQEVSLPAVSGEGFAAEIDRRWQAHLRALAPKKTQVYLSILRRPDLAARVPLLGALAKRTWVKDKAARARELNDVAGFFETALSAARPKRLMKNDGEWLGFLGTLLSGRFAPIAAPRSPLPLAHSLGACRATFEGDTVRDFLRDDGRNAFWRALQCQILPGSHRCRLDGRARPAARCGPDELLHPDPNQHYGRAHPADRAPDARGR